MNTFVICTTHNVATSWLPLPKTEWFSFLLYKLAFIVKFVALLFYSGSVYQQYKFLETCSVMHVNC